MATATTPVLDLTGSTRDIEDSHIGTSTRKNYIRTCIDFMLYLFDSHSILLVDLEALREANVNDLNAPLPRRRNNAQPPENLQRPRKQLKLLCRNLLEQTNRKDHNSPVRLTGDNSLKYDHIAGFMNTKRRVVAVNADVAARLAAEEGNTLEGDVDERNQVKVAVRLGDSSYSAVQSAVSFLYRQSGVDRSEEIKGGVSLYCKGSKRKGRKLKQDLGLEITEGKKAMSKGVYGFLAKTLFFSGDPEHIFAHLFLVLDWNLMKRAENCVDCKISHITVKSDCLVFQFAKSKGHQNGEEHVGPWHVYANPLEPHLCVVLSLARYLFTYPQLLLNNTALFQGTSQYNRYAKLFSNMLKENEEELKNMGVEPGDLGTHSCRKGVGTMVAAGCTVSPPIVSICVRAGWAMGGVKDKYLKRENAGDQYVGRCASCLNQLEKSFGVSPPYFDYSSLDELDQVRMKVKIKSWLIDRVLEYESVPPCTRMLIDFLFASICFHYTYLSENLDEECRFRASPFFIDIPQEFLECAKTVNPWEATKFSPKMTGVPPHIIIMAKMEELMLKFNALRVNLKDDFGGMLDCRGVGGSEYHTNQILDAIKTIGAPGAPVFNNPIVSDNEDSSSSASNMVISDEESSFSSDTSVDGIEESTEIQEIVQRTCRIKAKQVMRKRQLTMGFHHGKLQVLPPRWKFPKMNTKQLIDNWYVGNAREKIPPLALLSHHDVAHLGTPKNPSLGKVKMRQMRLVMSLIERYARIERCYIADKGKWTTEYARIMWEKVDTKYIGARFGGKNRNAELSWKTLYNKMMKAKAFASSVEDQVPVIEYSPVIEDPSLEGFIDYENV